MDISSRIWVGMVLLLSVAWPVQGQSVAEMYRAALFKEQAQRIFQKHGLQAKPFPPARVPVPSDSARRGVLGAEPEARPAQEPAPAFKVTRLRLIRRLERGWFERRFGNTPWAFLGSNYLTPFDTTRTRVLRARLEAHFGPPTQTLAELDLRSGKLQEEDYIQFEYWFVLNDSIPLKVVDVDGPFDRGVVVASDQRYRRILPDIRQAFIQQMGQTQQLAPYVDYYFDTVEQVWYRTGYDGRTFYLKKIRGPSVIRGRPLPGGS